MEKSQLLDVLKGSGQEHILDAYDTLTHEQQLELTCQVAHSGLNFTHLNAVLRESLALLNGSGTISAMATAPVIHVEPPPPDTLFAVAHTKRTDPATIRRLERLGFEAIRRGHAAVLILAGGSGTRLGLSIPKGLYTCELLLEKKSLFQFHCEKILRVQQLAHAAVKDENGCSTLTERGGVHAQGLIRVLVMVSEQNRQETESFFRENHWFGLIPAQIYFFPQSSLPCFEEATGKILMQSPYQMCLAPGGNGGVYQSLARALPELHSVHGNVGRETLSSGTTGALAESSSALSWLRSAGVRFVQIFSVDNLLAKLADPLFYGYTIDKKAHVTVKSVSKLGPEERVGVFAKISGTWGVVEYTEIGSARAAQRDAESGELLYNCANIACHTCSVEFLAHAAARMESTTHYHAARKRIDTLHGPVTGIKLESFIFDMFQYCGECAEAAGGMGSDDGFGIVQVQREEEFAPIKNADGGAEVTDTPRTAAQLLLQLHTHWAEQLLSSAPTASTSLGHIPVQYLERALQGIRSGVRQVEVSPLVSYQGEGLEPYAEYLVERLVHGSEEIVLVELHSNAQERQRLLAQDSTAKM